MRSFKKMTAVVMAVATLATSMVPFSADALYYNENSKFTYDLAVESESDDMIKVRNLGKKSLKEVKEKLNELGLGFKPMD